MYVHELMTRDVCSCSPDDFLEAAALLMWQNNCGSLPVLGVDRTPIGMITDRDIAMAAALNHKPLWEISVKEVLNGRMTHTCHAGDDIRSAMRTMWAQHVRRLPVLDEQGHLAGILSADDVASHAERGTRGAPPPPLSFDDAMTTLKSLAYHH